MNSNLDGISRDKMMCTAPSKPSYEVIRLDIDWWSSSRFGLNLGHHLYGKLSSRIKQEYDWLVCVEDGNKGYPNPAST